MFYHYFQAGGPLMWPLLICSLVSMVLCIERVVYWVRFSGQCDPRGLEEVLHLAGDGSIQKARTMLDTLSDPVGAVLRSGLEDPNHGVLERMDLTGNALLTRTRRGMAILDTIITIAPLLGILGTVMGIVDSFDLLSIAGELEEPRAVLGGIATALLTTAGGLIVSLLTLLPYNAFRVRIRNTTERINYFATLLEVELARPKGRS